MKKSLYIVTLTAFRVPSAMRARGMQLTCLGLVFLLVRAHHVLTELSHEVEGGRSSAVTHKGE